MSKLTIGIYSGGNLAAQLRRLEEAPDSADGLEPGIDLAATAVWLWLAGSGETLVLQHF